MGVENQNSGKPKSKKAKGDGLRTGRLSNEELKFIEANAGKLTADEMARKMNRRVDAITQALRKYVRAEVRKPSILPEAKEEAANARTARQELRTSLRSSEAYRILRQEFTEDELRYFEESYVQLMEQFDDVWPTERAMVIDTIRLDILKSRNLIDRRRLRDAIMDLEKEKEGLLAGRRPSELDPDEYKMYSAIVKQVGSLGASEKDKNAEFTNLVQRLESLMKSLKATRDQRLDDVKSGRVTILGLFKQLQNRDQQLAESRIHSLQRMAAERERARLSREHVYEDGSVDRPILSADTVVGTYDCPADGGAENQNFQAEEGD